MGGAAGAAPSKPWNASHEPQTIKPQAVSCAQDMMVWEAQLARRQRHANVMPLLAAFLHGQELWLILPLCACTLRALLDRAYPHVRCMPNLEQTQQP